MHMMTSSSPHLTSHTPQAPRAGPSLRTALVAPTASEQVPFVEPTEDVKAWHEQLYSVDVGSINHVLQLGFGYLDRKWILQGEKAGPLAMEFESTVENYFMVCGPPGRDQHCNATNTAWTIDGAAIGCKFRPQSEADGACACYFMLCGAYLMWRANRALLTVALSVCLPLWPPSPFCRRHPMGGAALRHLGPQGAGREAQAGAGQALRGRAPRDQPPRLLVIKSRGSSVGWRGCYLGWEENQIIRNVKGTRWTRRRGGGTKSKSRTNTKYVYPSIHPCRAPERIAGSNRQNI